MDYKGLFWGLLAGLAALALVLLFTGGIQGGQGSALRSTSIYPTASSTLYVVGDDISTQVLASYSNRRYARICNNTPNKSASQDIYLSLGSSAITATTSADQVIEEDECWEIERDFNYTGAIQVMSDASTSTDSVFVTELRD